MEENDWMEKAKLKRENRWRSMKEYACWICKTKSNQWYLGGYPCIRLLLSCPNQGHGLHDKLQSKVQKYSDEGHPKSYREELKKEIRDMRCDVRRE